MYRGVVFLLGLITVTQSLYVPKADLPWELDYILVNEDGEDVPVELEFGEEFTDDFNATTEGTYWQNGRTDNIWVHSSLSDETTGLKPPSDRGYLEINYPSNTTSYAHYHTNDVFSFPRGGVVQIDYFLTAETIWDVQLRVQTMLANSHANLIQDLTDTFENPPTRWQSAEVEIPASESLIRICIQGHRKRLSTTGLAIAKITVRSNLNITDDYSKIVSSTNWFNDKTDNIWVHSNLSSETSTSLRPPGEKGFIEINYPSNNATYAHYHTTSQLRFPFGGALSLDYWLVAENRYDVELKVNLVKRSSHVSTLLVLKPQEPYWQNANVRIPASFEDIQICIQGLRKRLNSTGLAISRIVIQNNTNSDKTTVLPVSTTAFAPETTGVPIVSTTEHLLTDEAISTKPTPTSSLSVTTHQTAISTIMQSTTRNITSPQTTPTTTFFVETSTVLDEKTTVIHFWTTQPDDTGLELLDDYSEIFNSTNWRNKKEDNVWVHNSLSDQTNAILRPPAGRGFIEINYPGTVNSYAHYHSVNYFYFPNGGNLQLDYWLRANAKTDVQIRIFTVVANSHATTLADITNENSSPDAGWVTRNIAIPASNEKIQICIQGHRRQIDSTGLVIGRILVENFMEIGIPLTEDYEP